jgi:hypothetical protein
MKKWIGPGLSFLLVLVLVFLTWPFLPSEQTVLLGREGEERPLILTQEKKDDRREEDSHFVQILQNFQEMVDGWLKSLNERIEREDVTRFEVRFLEILRNILEWVKEKLDEQIDSARDQKQRKEKGSFRETRWRVSPFSSKG